MPVERPPIRFGKNLAEIETKEALDATENHLWRHGLEVSVEPAKIPSKVKPREPSCTVFQQVPSDGRTVVRTRPDRGFGEHDETFTMSCVLKPASQRHAVIRQLREMRGRWLAGNLNVDDSKAQPFVMSVKSNQGARWSKDPTTFFRHRRLHLEDIWTELVEAERLTVHDSRAILEISEIVSKTKTVGDRVLRFEHELVWLQPIDDSLEVNGLEGAILVGLVRSEVATNRQVAEYFLQLAVLRTLVVFALPHQKGKTWPSCILLGNICRPAVLNPTVEIKTKPPPAARAYVLRKDALPQSIQA